MDLAEALLSGCGFQVVTPREEHRRGGHVALAHPEAVRICRALKAAGVVPDYRPPKIVRLAPVPLYTTFMDCFEAVTRLCRIVETREYERYSGERERVA